MPSNSPRRLRLHTALPIEITTIARKRIPTPVQQYANVRRLEPFHSPVIAPQKRPAIISTIMNMGQPRMPPRDPSEAAPIP